MDIIEQAKELEKDQTMPILGEPAKRLPWTIIQMFYNPRKRYSPEEMAELFVERYSMRAKWNAMTSKDVEVITMCEFCLQDGCGEKPTLSTTLRLKRLEVNLEFCEEHARMYDQFAIQLHINHKEYDSEIKDEQNTAPPCFGHYIDTLDP